MNDHAIILSPEVIQQLSALHSESKFQAEGMYPGAPDEDIRVNSERIVNEMLDGLQAGLHQSPRKSYVIAQFLEMLKCFEHDDTEEREQACRYCERVMDILHIESSDGLLNKWLYGFDPEDVV